MSVHLFSKEHQQRIIDAVRTLESLTTPAYAIGYHEHQDRDWWYGIITNVGPAEEEDFSDSRYWVIRAEPVASEDPYELSYAILDEDHPRYLHIVATNIAERFDDHILPVGTLVRVREHQLEPDE